MSKKDTNQEDLFKEVLSLLQSRTSDPNVIITALGRAMLVILQAAQMYYKDPEGVKKTAEKSFNDILSML